MTLSREQFNKAVSAGFTPEQIAGFEKRRIVETREAKKPASKMKQIDENIAKRGNYFLNLESDIKSPSNFRKWRGVFAAGGAAPAALEHTVAGPMLEMQRGNFNPQQLASSAFEGFLGKQNQYGDVLRGAGVPEPLAAAGGLAVSFSPLSAINRANKTFGAVTKMTDKGIKRAGESLVKASDEAHQAISGKLDEAFKVVDGVKVDPNDALRVISKVPQRLLSKIEEEVFGGAVDLNALTVGQLRKVKQYVGKFKPTSYGREDRGLTENLDASDMNDLYAGLKSLLTNSVVNAKGMGKRVAGKLLDLEDKASEVFHSTQYIKNKIYDPILQKATKGGVMADKMVKIGDSSAREALSVIKEASTKARKQINSAVNAMESFNRWRAISGAAEHALGAGLYGGVAGSTGGMILGKIIGKNRD